MTRTEWDWLLGKPTDETMLVVDDGVLAMFDEYVKKKCAEAFQRGAAAMREAAAKQVVAYSIKVVDPLGRVFPVSGEALETLANAVRALPEPEDAP